MLVTNDLDFAGDVIIGLEGRKVTRAGDLVIALDDFNIGDTVSLTVQRGVGQQQVSFSDNCLDVAHLGLCCIQLKYLLGPHMASDCHVQQLTGRHTRLLHAWVSLCHEPLCGILPPCFPAIFSHLLMGCCSISPDTTSPVLLIVRLCRLLLKFVLKQSKRRNVLCGIHNVESLHLPSELHQSLLTHLKCLTAIDILASLGAWLLVGLGRLFAG